MDIMVTYRKGFLNYLSEIFLHFVSIFSGKRFFLYVAELLGKPYTYIIIQYRSIKQTSHPAYVWEVLTLIKRGVPL